VSPAIYYWPGSVEQEKRNCISPGCPRQKHKTTRPRETPGRERKKKEKIPLRGRFRGVRGEETKGHSAYQTGQKGLAQVDIERRKRQGSIPEKEVGGEQTWAKKPRALRIGRHEEAGRKSKDSQKDNKKTQKRSVGKDEKEPDVQEKKEEYLR